MGKPSKKQLTDKFRVDYMKVDVLVYGDMECDCQSKPAQLVLDNAKGFVAFCYSCDSLWMVSTAVFDDRGVVEDKTKAYQSVVKHHTSNQYNNIRIEMARINALADHQVENHDAPAVIE